MTSEENKMQEISISQPINKTLLEFAKKIELSVSNNQTGKKTSYEFSRRKGGWQFVKTDFVSNGRSIQLHSMEKSMGLSNDEVATILRNRKSSAKKSRNLVARLFVDTISAW